MSTQWETAQERAQNAGKPPTHRKQLREAQTKLGVAARSIRSGDTAAAQTAVDEAEAIVATIREESGYDADHAVFRSYNRLLEARKEALGVTVDAPTAAAAGGEMAAGGVSFSNDIQPWLNSQCNRAPISITQSLSFSTSDRAAPAYCG